MSPPAYAKAAAPADVPEPLQSELNSAFLNKNRNAIEVRDFKELKNTQITSAVIGDRVFSKQNWNGVLLEIIAIIKERMGLEGEALTRELNEFNIGATSYPHEHYPYDSVLGITVPNKNAETCARKLKQFAKKYHIYYRINFYWESKAREPFANKCGYIAYFR